MRGFSYTSSNFSNFSKLVVGELLPLFPLRALLVYSFLNRWEFMMKLHFFFYLQGLNITHHLVDIFCIYIGSTPGLHLPIKQFSKSMWSSLEENLQKEFVIMFYLCRYQTWWDKKREFSYLVIFHGVTKFPI